MYLSIIYLVLIILVVTVLINGIFRTKYLFDYTKSAVLVEVKLKESYNIFRTRDLMTYVNNKSKIDKADFAKFSKSFIDLFRMICGNKLYETFISVYGDEESLISYVIIKFSDMIMNDRVFEVGQELFKDDKEAMLFK